MDMYLILADCKDNSQIKWSAAFEGALGNGSCTCLMANQFCDFVLDKFQCLSCNYCIQNIFSLTAKQESVLDAEAKCGT